MATFVLVHGMCHGGWCWKRLTPLLMAAGHVAYAPTLTGLGERVHLAHPDVGLTTHVQDVVKLLEYEDLADVILVGHSLGGMVTTGVANDAAHRLAHLVYLDAVVPQHGQSRWDLFDPPYRARLEERVRTGDGWRVPPESGSGNGGSNGGCGRLPMSTADDTAWVRDRLVPHPLKALYEPVRLDNPAAATLLRTYIYCTQKPPGDDVCGVRAPFIRRARTEPGWRYRELATVHAAMLTAPQALANLLLELV